MVLIYHGVYFICTGFYFLSIGGNKHSVMHPWGSARVVSPDRLVNPGARVLRAVDGMPNLY